MEHDIFDGSLVLERLASSGRLGAFYEAVDDDDVARANALMLAAGVSAEHREAVVQKLTDGDD